MRSGGSAVGLALTVTVAAWSDYDEGDLPQVAPPMRLGPCETTHLQLSCVALHGYFGRAVQHCGPIGLALARAAEQERAARPRWHALGDADLVMTSQRLVLTLKGEAQSLWYAETGPLQLVTDGGAPAVQLQPARMPLLRIESSSAAVLYLMVRRLLA